MSQVNLFLLAVVSMVSLLAPLLSLVLVLGGVHGYGSGPPPNICFDMTPKHNADAQLIDPPYQITASAGSYSPGDVINGELYQITYSVYTVTPLFCDPSVEQYLLGEYSSFVLQVNLS